MNRRVRVVSIFAIGLVLALSSQSGLRAQTIGPSFFVESAALKAAHPAGGARCSGPLRFVNDVGFEGVKVTGFNWANATGGGEGKRYDPVPVLTTSVALSTGTCLNAHLSALVGSKVTYGVAALTMFQVTLTPLVAGGVPQHMYGHYETPYGIFAPAVAIEAERDVDEFSANFFQRVGTQPGDVPPGNYRVDVWWSGGPIGGGGAIGAAFVLKLYQG